MNNPGWLDGMFSKIIFQLEERMEPFAVAGENGRAVAEYGEGGFVLCRHRFVPLIMASPLSLTV